MINKENKKSNNKNINHWIWNLMWIFILISIICLLSLYIYHLGHNPNNLKPYTEELSYEINMKTSIASIFILSVFIALLRNIYRFTYKIYQINRKNNISKINRKQINNQIWNLMWIFILIAIIVWYFLDMHVRWYNFNNNNYAIEEYHFMNVFIAAEIILLTAVFISLVWNIFRFTYKIFNYHFRKNKKLTKKYKRTINHWIWNLKLIFIILSIVILSILEIEIINFNFSKNSYTNDQIFEMNLFISVISITLVAEFIVLFWNIYRFFYKIIYFIFLNKKENK